jgi:hypothetical protein
VSAAKRKFISVVEQARATTARSTLDLLTLPWPFSQVQLLSANEFVRHVEDRRIGALGGWKLDLSGFEDLHRTGVLVPFYRVRLFDPDPEQAIDVAASRTLYRIGSTVTNELYRGAAEGRVTDPANEPFEPWPSIWRRHLWPTYDSAYLYSYHQLLGLRRARTIVGSLQSHHHDHSMTWLEDEDVPDHQTLANCRSWRGLAVVLSALDTTYWPGIMQTVSFGLDEWREHRLAFEPGTTLQWLGVSVDDVAGAADQLRYGANFEDVLGDFYDIVRRAKPKAWSTMRGPALTTMDDRVAAEVLHRTVEEINADSPTPAYPEPLAHQWLGARPISLDATLNDIHLSPHPSLVVAVEGETEQLLLPRVFALLGIRDDPTFIRTECFGGTDKDLSLLARFAAAPQLGADHGRLVLLDRPVTRFLVLTDAENKYRDATERRRQRLLLLNSITAAVPNDLKADLYQYGRLARIVEIRTWGKYPFEFAHFTDEQLADGILSVTTRHHPGGRTALVTAIRQQRTVDPSPNISDAWRHSGVSKLQLAEALWTRLEKRIKRAIGAVDQGPPIMAAALRAYELASLSYGRSTVLRRRRWRPPKA